MNEWEFKATVVDAIGRFLTAALWPALVLVLVAGFSYPLWRLLARLSDLEEAEVAGQKVKFRKGVESANEAIDHAEENGAIVSPTSVDRQGNSQSRPERERADGTGQNEQPTQPDVSVQVGGHEQAEERIPDKKSQPGERREPVEERSRDEKREQDFARLEHALHLSRSDYEEWIQRGLRRDSIDWVPRTRREQKESGPHFWQALTRREQKESRASDAAFTILDAWAELERGVLRQSRLRGLSFSRVQDAIRAMRPDLAEALMKLRETRNLVAHAEYSPTESDAQAYALAARRFLQRLEPINLDVEPDDDEGDDSRADHD